MLNEEELDYVQNEIKFLNSVWTAILLEIILNVKSRHKSISLINTKLRKTPEDKKLLQQKRLLEVDQRLDKKYLTTKSKDLEIICSFFGADVDWFIKNTKKLIHNMENEL
jgi:hypothetical protein